MTLRQLLRLEVLLLLLVSGLASSRTSLAQSQPSRSSCDVDRENIPWSFPLCALQVRYGKQYVPVPYLKKVEFNRFKLGWLHIDNIGFVYVNPSGRIVIRDVSIIDNGADYFHHGVVRLERNGKYGFANARGRIVVPIQYDGASNSDDEGPTVNIGCKVEHQGEYSWCAGGKDYRVGSKGEIISK